jgi:hypothetical protein
MVGFKPMLIGGKKEKLASLKNHRTTYYIIVFYIKKRQFNNLGNWRLLCCKAQKLIPKKVPDAYNTPDECNINLVTIA